MAYELELTGADDGNHTSDLCAGGGYPALCDWIESLDKDTYPSLRAFADQGSFAGTDKLVAELETAIADDQPEDGDVLHTANHLADLLGAGRPNETASVT